MRHLARMTLGLALIGLIITGSIVGCASYTSHSQGKTALAPASAEGLHSRMAPGEIVPGASEELWIIERPRPDAVQRAGKEEAPGSGALMAQLPAEQRMVPVPLKHTDVKASIAGYMAAVDVIQQYHNPFDVKIEAVYVFPLPHNAAINEFVMTIGERKIRGIIRERQQAEQIYKEARAQGYVASLMTQDRPNIFTQKVANIEPGKQIDVSIRYYHTLGYVDGWYEFVFPMVVGPRYNPAGSADGVGAVERGGHGISGQKTEVQYLAPTERSGHDIALAVEIDAAVKIENIQCRSHAIDVKNVEGQRAAVSLAQGDRIPNKDFVLRYQVAGQAAKSGLIVHRDQRGGYFSIMLVPPATDSNLPRQPLEFVFTLDTSGSMSGRPIEQSRAAMRHALRQMNASDTFQIIQFDNTSRKLFDVPQPATAANVKRGMSFINSLRGGGGTEMTEGMRASLRFPHDEERLRVVAFLTDGFIGNERDVLREVHGALGPARIFSFGVGSSPNRFLMEQMARMGSGCAAFVGLKDPAEEAMEGFFTRVSRPAMANVTLDFGPMRVSEVYPERIPDLYVGRPVIITGRFDGDPGQVKLRGMLGGRPVEMAVAMKADLPTAAHKALPVIWARSKIADLCEDAVWQENRELPGQIQSLALEYGLVSPYTAFIAVDASQRTAGDHGVTVFQPVPVPDGVRYDTTVQPRDRRPQQQQPEASAEGRPE